MNYQYQFSALLNYHYKFWLLMPDESCRTCGGTLVNCSLCPGCRKMTQRICNTCGFKTKEQIHSNCLYLESSQTRNGMKINVIAHMPNKRGEINQKSEKTRTLRNTLLVFGIVGFFVLGFVAADYFDFFQNQTSESQAIKTTIPQPLGPLSKKSIRYKFLCELINQTSFTITYCIGIIIFCNTFCMLACLTLNTYGIGIFQSRIFFCTVKTKTAILRTDHQNNAHLLVF